MKKRGMTVARIGLIAICMLGVQAVGCNVKPQETMKTESVESNKDQMPKFSMDDFELSDPISVVSVEVRTKDGLGKSTASGVILTVDEKGVQIVTAGHALDGMEKSDVLSVIIGDESVICKNSIALEEADLAFLSVLWEDFSPKALETLILEEVHTDKSCFDALQNGAEVTAKGYHNGALAEYCGTLSDMAVFVEDFEQNMLLIRCEAYPGMSGGGVYDAEGHFMGIICGIDEEGTVACVPWHVIEERLITYY